MKNTPSWVIRVLRDVRAVSDSVNNVPMRLGLIGVSLATLKDIDRRGFLTLENGYVDITSRGWVLLGQKPKRRWVHGGRYETALSMAASPPEAGLRVARVLDAFPPGEYGVQDIAVLSMCLPRQVLFWCGALVDAGVLTGVGEKPFTSWKVK